VEDRIYRSLRTAQERELHGHPTPARPDAAPLPSGPAPIASAHSVAAASASVLSAPAPEAVHGPVAPAPHGPAQATDPLAIRWFTRGFGADRPRISIVGTLSLSVLIIAGFFGAREIVNKRHKHSGASESAAADSVGAMRVAAHHPDDAEDDNSGPVSVPSRFQHVHAPASHARARSTHAVALDEQPATEENASDESSDSPNSSPAAKSHHRLAAGTAMPGTSSHRAPEEPDASQLDVETTTQPFDRSVPAPSAVPNHDASSHEGTDHALPAPAGQQPAPATTPGPADHLTVQPNVASNQPGGPTNVQSNDSASSRWPLVPSASPAASASGTVQVSAEASNAPTLTIVPGRPDNIRATLAAQSGAAQSGALQSGQLPALAQQPLAEPIVNRPMDLPPAGPSQPTSVTGLFQDRPVQDRPEVAPVAAAIPQPGPNLLDTLDRTKVMSFQFRNAPWSLVLANFAFATGLELRMQAFPTGTFNRWDSARYTPTQTLTILNAELSKLGCQAKAVGTALYVVPATAGDGAIPASATVPANVPAVPPSSQLPQYPGVPVSGTATSGTR
jgi:hypothetical protein